MVETTSSAQESSARETNHEAVSKRCRSRTKRLPQTQEFHTREKRGREVKPQSTNKEAAQNFKRNELYSRKRTLPSCLYLRTHVAENPQTTQEHWIGLHQKPIKPLPSVSPPYVLLEIMIAEQAKPKEQTSIRIERKNRRETEGIWEGLSGRTCNAFRGAVWRAWSKAPGLPWREGVLEACRIKRGGCALVVNN